MDFPAAAKMLPASSFWPLSDTDKNMNKKKRRSNSTDTGSVSSVSDAYSDTATDYASLSDGASSLGLGLAGGGGEGGRLLWSSSRGDDQFVHVSSWYDVYGCCPCSKTETILLACQPPTDLSPTAVDITTGHAILSYMEEVASDPGRVEREWQDLQQVDGSDVTGDLPDVTAAHFDKNQRKNRSSATLPYDSNRFKLQVNANVSASDYINASTIVDDDPLSPAYIITQGPLPHTVADFWQMVWESGSTTIVNLSPELDEEGRVLYHRYWPEEGAELYFHYEVCLVSEHVWCADYVVCSLYLKNVRTRESRTVTLFHFLTWPDRCAPSSALPLLDMRRKINKCYKGSQPLIVHCSDGGSRSGTFCLIDMVLKRITRGAKEVDIAATAEHIRDQRADTMNNKDNFEFAFLAVATELFDMMSCGNQPQY